jgi:hypothetical protein
MDLSKNNLKKLLWAIPAIAAFLIALIPTIKYQWPLGWDIIYHIQYAKVYALYGFTLNDPLLNAPLGQKIGYPPLFHFLVASLGTLLKADFFQIARFLQPIFAMFIVLSVSYVARKFYGSVAGISAGFLVLSSYLITRIVLPLPENLALIFLPLSVYLYYLSAEKKRFKYALISGIIFIIVILAHQGAILSVFLTVTSLTLIELIFYRDLRALKNYAGFLVPLISLAVVGVVVILFLSPDIINGILNQGINAAIGLSTSLTANRPSSLLTYLGSMGFLVLIFAAIGGIMAIKKRDRKDLYILTWIMAMVLLSKADWFGINVISYRVLIYILIPLSILGGFGLSGFYDRLKLYKNFSSPKFRAAFLISIFALCMFQGVLTVENPKIAVFKVKNDFESVQIAPPSLSEVDLANWFQENGDKNRSFVISNQFSGMFLTTETDMPMHYGFELYSLKNTNKSAFQEQNIGYIIYDKKLVLPNQNNQLQLTTVNSEFYPLYYFNKDIKTNINEIIPDYATIVYENDEFIVVQIKY